MAATTAYELNDFEAIAVSDGAPLPLCAGDDIAVVFYGDAIFFEA